ncbi:hypothetical protein A3L09_10675 (plasmid) [Thermococcus profundus]|uniref:HTH marR-type domain-containing protein n=1 Tax=Thermococcus profundus TaxID=49899 RepID=A0A2Z2MJ01_THEPR|nr:MarR family transcriptional regulator [Thermococcus profundus]ASJ03814.1 hypothetical protein A3L09_10675 [Thermococcus profundus]
MSLTKSELKVLLALDEPMTLKELAEKLNLSKPTLSVTISSLERKGLIERQSKKPLTIKPANNKATQLLKRIKTEYSHLNLEKLLSGNYLKTLAALKVETPQPPWLLQLKANVSRPTLHRILNELMEHLIVGKTKEGYFLNERFALLKAFAEEYFWLENTLKVEEFDPSATVVWSGVGELILTTKKFKGKSVGEFQLTGLARFSDFGLPLISSGVYHYYRPAREISLEEVVVHTLRLGSDTRELLYASALLRGVSFDEKKLRKLAAKFEVSDVVDDLLEFLKGVPKHYPFPSREEVEELWRQYFGGHKYDHQRKTD